MVSPLPASPKITFGPFEIDACAGKLFKGGIPIRLQPQPFKVLLLLVRNAGEVITREQIQQHLWGDSTFVDFERGINFSINQIRVALCDDADHPRYIETLPRVGYRFVAAITSHGRTKASSIPSPSAHIYQWPEVAEPAEPATSASVAPIKTLPRPGSQHIENEPVRRIRWYHAAALLLISVILAFAGLAIFQWRESRRASLGEVRSLAVLPLENLSGEVAQDYFADGMTDALITDLGKIGSIRVISRTSAMQYKGVHKPLAQIGRELNVDAVVEGSVLRSGNRVRITAQLVEAHEDRHLWAQSYEGDLGDVLNLQSEVASSIASEIRLQLTPQQQAIFKGQRFLNAAAQDAYLRGHYFAQQGTNDDLQKAIRFFNQAIEMEPSKAASYAGLASAYIDLGHRMFLGPQQAFPPAKAAALKALALEDASEEAHTAMGNVKFLYDWDFPAAEKEFQLALQLNPNSVAAQSSYAGFLNAMGRRNEAIARIEHTLQLDPLSLAAITDVAWQLYWAGRYDEAIEKARKVTELDAAYFPAHVCLGLAYEQKHDFTNAIRELESATGFCRDKCFGLIGQVSALAGDRRGALDALQKLRQRQYVSPWLVAIVYAELHERDQAFFWLEKAYRDREHDLVFSNVWPMFDSLRSDPRFQDLMRRIGLPQPT